MRHILRTLLALLGLASPLAAQASKSWCTVAQLSNPHGQDSVVMLSATRQQTFYSSDLNLRIACTAPQAAADSLALAVLRKALTDTAAALKVARDSLAKWPKPCACDSTVTPPKDTTPTPPPPPPADTSAPSGSAVLFRSDWSGGLLDGGKWTRWGGRGSLAVVDAAGHGFPATMGSVLRVQHYQQDFDWIMANGKWPLPPIGGSLAFRVYLRSEVSDTDGDKGTAYASTHPVESWGQGSGISGNYYVWKYGSYSDGTFPLLFETGSGSGFTPGASTSTHGGRTYDPATVQKFTTYRLEWKFTRRAANQYDLDARLYAADGTLLYDRAHWYRWAASGTMATAGNGLTIGDSYVTQLRLGINGGFATGSPQFFYWGGFAVCADWCGPYAAGR